MLLFIRIQYLFICMHKIYLLLNIKLIMPIIPNFWVFYSMLEIPRIVLLDNTVNFPNTVFWLTRSLLYLKIVFKLQRLFINNCWNIDFLHFTNVRLAPFSFRKTYTSICIANREKSEHDFYEHRNRPNVHGIMQYFPIMDVQLQLQISYLQFFRSEHHSSSFRLTLSWVLISQYWSLKIAII